MTEQVTAAKAANRVPVATFTNYSEAERAVEYLAEVRFPIERVAIVGEDVHMVEQVVNRLSFGRAAWHGAVSGGLTGLLFGWLFGLFDWIRPVIASLTLAAYGLIFGAILGLILYSLLARTPRLLLCAHPDAPHDVVADLEVAEEAARVLQERDGRK
jgi:heat induced stress protein YflT